MRYCHSRQKRQGKALRDTREQASPPFGKALPSAALPLHARFLVERGAMAGGEILIGKHMLLRALMLDAVAGARRAEPGGSGHVKAVQEVLGHEHLNTTEIYTHIANEALRVAAKANPLSRVKPPKKNKAGK